MKSFRTSFRAISLPALGVVTIALASCNGDPKKDGSDAATDSLMAVSAEAWKSRRALADSIIKNAPPITEVVTQLGASRYDEADADLTAAVLKESEKTRDCYTKVVRDIDPNLTAVLYVLVNFGGAGWDLVRVEKWTPTTGAIGAVISCINYRAKTEWKLPTKGVKPGAHLVKIVYTPDSVATKGGE